VILALGTGGEALAEVDSTPMDKHAGMPLFNTFFFTLNRG
jgi:hypothetical protein